MRFSLATITAALLAAAIARPSETKKRDLAARDCDLEAFEECNAICPGMGSGGVGNGIGVGLCTLLCGQQTGC